MDRVFLDTSPTSKVGAIANDKTLLLTAILADAINLGLTKMAESCPGTTHSKTVLASGMAYSG